MKKLKIGILITFIVLFFCEFLFPEWRIRNVNLENIYYIFFYAIGLTSITIFLKYLIDKFKFSPILIAGIITGIFALLFTKNIGINIEMKQMLFPMILMSFLCFAICLVYLSILKSNKIFTIILNIIALLILIFLQVSKFDQATKYLCDNKIISEKNGEKIVIRNIKNIKMNKITQDTVKVKDILIFRKKMK
ncbi:hypothetical protein [Riemerella anatipestifer]|uniref:hypothetical protein n=1 Tax=Riemerella anatipestifer TaxID=34085 RepID=UPI003DA94251